MRGRTGKGREAWFFRFPATALPVQVQRDFLSRTTRADSAAPLTCSPKVLELPGLGKRKGRKRADDELEGASDNNKRLAAKIVVLQTERMQGVGDFKQDRLKYFLVLP